MKNTTWIYIITWEVKRTGDIKYLTTFDKVEYECFLEYLKEYDHLFEIIENYVLDVK